MLKQELLSYSDEQISFFEGFFTRLIQEYGACSDDRYYLDRVKLRVGGISPYDESIIKWVTTTWPAETRPNVVHAGAGIGFLGAILAVNGCRVVSLDYHPRSAEAAQAVRAAVIDLIPEAAERLVIRNAGYPEVLAHGLSPPFLPERDNVLIFTNVGAGWNHERYERIVSTFVDYRYVVLSPRVFGELRKDPIEWRQLLEDIARRVPVAECTVVDWSPPVNSWAVIRMAKPSTAWRKVRVKAPPK